MWALVALPALGVVLWLVWRRIVRRRLARFVAARQLPVAVPFVRWYARGAVFALTVLSLMLLAVAMARPLRGPLPDKAKGQGIDFVIALDVSKSMWVEDVAPNRLAAVKKELGDWLKLPSGDRVGLVVFAGDAFVQAPLTFDRVALDTVLQQAGPRSMSVGGTNIPQAVEMATHLLKTSESRSRCLVIISDGENLEGDAVGAVREARARDGLNVFTVGVGTLAGGRVPAEDYGPRNPGDRPRGLFAPPPPPPGNRSYVSNEYGTGVTSRLDNRSLRLLAEAGGGRYYEFRPGAQTFEVLRTQGMLPMTAKPRTVDVSEYQEWFQLPLGAAIAALAAARLIPVRAKRPKTRPAAIDGVVTPETFSRPANPVPARAALRAAGAATLLALAFATPASAAPTAAATTPAVPATSTATAPTSATPWTEAEKLLAAKKPDDAVELMRKAVQTEAPDQWLAYNYAMTLYRAGRYEEAVPAFEAVRQTADAPALREKAAVLAGNALTHLGAALVKKSQQSGAILSLERALGHYDDSAPTPGPEAAHNRKVAATRLESILVEAGKRYVQSADRSKDNPAGEEGNLRNALQAYERVETLNPANADAPKQAEEIRQRLAENLSKQGTQIAAEADKMDKLNLRPEAVLGRLDQAAAKVDDALALTPQNQPIQKQKQDIQNQASDVLTKAAERQADKPLQKEKLNDSEQFALAQAKAKLDQAAGLNPDNRKAKELGEKVAAKLEKSLVERGQEALANAEKTNSLPGKLGQAATAADQFQKALGVNAENADAKKGLAEANAMLPDLYAAAGDAEATKAKEAAGEATAAAQAKGKGKPTAAAPKPDLRKAIGHLEKADQNYGVALGMKPADADLQRRAQEVRDLLNATRDQLDQKSRDELAAEAQNAQAAADATAQADQPGEKPGDKPGEQAGQPNGPPPAKKPLSMADLKQKGKPLTGDNFWEKKVRDW